MKLINITSILLFLIATACSTNKPSSLNKNLNNFNQYLGTTKSSVLDQAVFSLESFLLVNYPKTKKDKRVHSFLKDLALASNTGPDTNWVFNTKINKELVVDFESSGMRKEIAIYGYENYENNFLIDSLYFEEDKSNNENVVEGEMVLEELIKEDSIYNYGRDTTGDAEFYRISEEQNKLLIARMDSNLSFNVYGQFLYALAKHTENDVAIQNYVEARREAGDLSPSLLFNAYLEQDFDYNSPFFKRILVADVYLDLIKWDINRKEK